MRHCVSLALLAPLGLLIACSGSGSTGPNGPEATATASASVAEPVSTAQPSASAGASASASAPPSKPAESPFVAIAKLDGAFNLFPVDNAMVVAGQDAKPAEGESRTVNWIGVVEGDKVRFEKDWYLEGWFHNVVGVAGSWPDDATLLAVGDTGRSPVAERYEVKGKLKAAKGAGETRRYLGLLRTKTSLVGVDAPFFPMNSGMSFTTFKGAAVKLTPRPAPKECSDMKPKYALAMPAAVGALPDGTVLVYGVTCGEKGEPSIESFKEGAASTITPLGNATDMSELPQFVVGRDGDAWLVGGGLYHLEGGAWTKVATPGAGESVLRGAIGKDGALYVACDSGLYRRAKDRWEEVVLPADAKPQDVAVDKDGVMYVVAGGALLRERRGNESAAGAASVPVAGGATAPRKARKAPTPGGPRCKSNVVVLYGFTKVTPDDYDFPQTRKALKGHIELNEARFVVTRDGNQKYFVAKTPSYGLAKQVAAVIEKGVQGAKPAIVCAEPEVVRELGIDLQTGNVRK